MARLLPRHRDPVAATLGGELVVIEIALTKGYIALIDDADLGLIRAAGSWCAAECGSAKVYAQSTINRTCVRMHTYLTGWAYVDHINGNGLDNQRSNLRHSTPGQNNSNRGPSANNTTGFKGVNLYRNGRYRATIRHQDRQFHLGYFDSAIEAALAYDYAAGELHGEFGRPNFPREDIAS